MAKVIPSGVLKLPNFAELDYNLKRQKTQDALKAEEFSSQFKEITGNYLAGDLEAVQSSYDAVEEARDRLATDPRNVNLIRALRTAHANHAKVAGTAQFLANNNRDLKANFIANPDAYALSGTEGFRLLNLDANTPRSSEQIFLAGASPIEFNPTVAKMKNYNQVAEEAYKRFLRKEDEFYDANGNLLKDKARDWFKTHMSSNYENEKEVNNALIYEGYQQGLLGDGETASTLGYKIGNDDLTKINSKNWQDKFGIGLLDDFTTSALTQFESILPGSNVSARDRRKDELQEQNILSSINARFKQSGGKGQNKVIGATLNYEFDEKVPLGTLWSTAGTKIAPSVFSETTVEGYKPQYNITAFGYNGKNVFTRRLYQPTDSSMPSKAKIYPANQDDITAIKNTIGVDYFNLLISDFVPVGQTNTKDEILIPIPDEIKKEKELTDREKLIKKAAERAYRFQKMKDEGKTFGSNIGQINKEKLRRNNEFIDSMDDKEKKFYNSILEQIPKTAKEEEVSKYEEVKSDLEEEGLNTLSSDQLSRFESTSNTRDDITSVKSKYKEFVEKEISKIDGSSNFGYESKEKKIKDFIEELKNVKGLRSVEELNKYIDSFKSSISEEEDQPPTAVSRGDGRTTRQDVLDDLIAEQEALEKKAKSGKTLSKEERERKNRIGGEIKDMRDLILESPGSEQLAMQSAPINSEFKEGGKIPSNPLSKIVSRIKNAIYPS